MWGGIAFSLAFTALIWWAGQRLASIPHLPDQGAAWYYWKLPNPPSGRHFTAWMFYALHQITLWSLIFYAQTRVKTYTTGLHPVNVWALGVNAFFILLHFVQTHIWYDGLAQDVSIFSSQGSVILMLVAILLMENQRRGLFLGKKVSFAKRIGSFARKYHGYLFAWATVYTFWYHPMENTPGHLVGFLYMFLLLLQGSLFLTRIHLNKWWTLDAGSGGGRARHAGGDLAGPGIVADVRLRLRRHLHPDPDARTGLEPPGALAGGGSVRRCSIIRLQQPRLGTIE